MKWRKSIRLKNYNYKTDGYYFVTIVTRNRLPLLREYKQQIEECINNLPKFISGLSIDYFTVGVNHIHVIFIFANCSRPLGRVVSAMKSAITKIVAANINSQNIVDLHQPPTVDLHQPIVDLHQPLQLWEWNYYEHIIRNEKALYEIRKYIQENPLKEKINFNEIYRRINQSNATAKK